MTDTPMTADREQAPWGRDGDGRPLLPMGAHWTDIPELVDQHLTGIQNRVDQSQPGTWYLSPTAAAEGMVCTQYDGYTQTVGQVANMLPGDQEMVLHAHSDLSWCLDLIRKLRARVAELDGAAGTARAMHRKHADSEHCQYDDMTWPCPTVTALGDPSEAVEPAYRSSILPSRVATCTCGHSGADHHHAGTACWATLPRTRHPRTGVVGPVATCICSKFTEATP